MEDGLVILDKPNQILWFHRNAQLKALKLEAKGIRFKGGSVLATVKRQMGWKGNREKIVALLEQEVERLKNGNQETIS